MLQRRRWVEARVGASACSQSAVQHQQAAALQGGVLDFDKRVHIYAPDWTSQHFGWSQGLELQQLGGGGGAV